MLSALATLGVIFVTCSVIYLVYFNDREHIHVSNEQRNVRARIVR